MRHNQMRKKMKLKLKSNFFEVWHSAFDSEGLEFRLVTTDGISRPEMFFLFTKLGIPTPLYGTFDDFVKKGFDSTQKVVVYDDIRSHLGENKRLCVFSDLEGEDKIKFLSEYIKPTFSPQQEFLGKSTRYIFIGDIGFEYDYYSCNDWRSNNGRVIITEPLRIDIPKWRKEINYAMFAIDFVGQHYEMKAIDLNCAPGVPNSLRKYIKSNEMVYAIKKWLEEYGKA